MAGEWARVLKKYDLPFFHMVDCAHGNEHFASLTRAQRIEAETALIGIIKRRAAHGFAVSVDLAAYQELMPDWGPAKSPYAFCARCVIDEIGKWFSRSGFRGKSTYFFEAGHASRSEASKVVEAALTNPLSALHNVHYGYAAHSFIPKQGSAAVQAADLLAWQWATEVKHRMTGRPRRKDFASLLDIPHRGAHFDKARLLYYVRLLKEFGVPASGNETEADLVARMLYVQRRAQPYMQL